MQKILIIEDEALLRESLVEWLTFEGYTAIDAEDGISGVETALHEQPDVILSDITMPRLNGYGVLSAMRTHPAMTNIPFIFISARAAQEDINEGLALGADAYVTKPFKYTELLQVIQRCIAQKQGS